MQDFIIKVIVKTQPAHSAQIVIELYCEDSWNKLLNKQIPILPPLSPDLFSVLRMTSTNSLYCAMVLLRYVLISFSYETDLLAPATVTGRIRNSLMAVTT